MNHEEETKTWKGTGLSDLCKGKNLWSFNVVPVTISKYHSVLYELPVNLREPPKPYASSNPHHWDENYVRMPFSDRNLYPVTEHNGQVIKKRWDIIKESLSQKINNSRDLERAVKTYNSSFPDFGALHYFFEKVVEEEEATLFFEIVFPKIVKLALKIPDIIPGSLPLLRKGQSRSVSLSQLQISCILANAFLCTFPWRKDIAGSFPGINFQKLFAAHTRTNRVGAVMEKLKCIFHYFRRVTDNVPVGVVTFERKFRPKSQMYRWDTSELNLAKTKIHVDSKGTIEDDGLGFLQVDFANKNVGGGVLGYGCVQEEIRFVICPELLVSRLFIERLGDQEAVIVTGPERYSKYAGYSDSFMWEGDNKDEIPYDQYGRRRTTISIIDATCFNKPRDQFYPSAMLRELNKAYIGFSTRENNNLSPVATGNWGCGAFRGSAYLKTLLQLMACAAAERDMVYYTFGDEELRDNFYNMYTFLATNNITIGTLWKIICEFANKKLPEEQLYSYIQQSFFDLKNKPKSPKKFTFQFKRRDSGKPGPSEEVKAVGSKQSGESPTIDDENVFEADFKSTDDDIIPATPPSEMNNIKKKSKTKSKPTNEEIAAKLPKTDIIELIQGLEDSPSPSKVVQEESFLSHIENLSKKIKLSTSDEDSPEIIESSQEVNVDRITTSKNLSKAVIESVQSASASKKTGPKKSITDYFQKSFKSS